MKTIFLFLLVLSLTLLSNKLFSQNEVNSYYQKNGVKVQEAKGVEQVKKTEAKQKETSKQQNTIENLTLEECEKAVFDIESKIEFLENRDASKDEIERYTKQLNVLNERILKLKSIK